MSKVPLQEPPEEVVVSPFESNSCKQIRCASKHARCVAGVVKNIPGSVNREGFAPMYKPCPDCTALEKKAALSSCVKSRNSRTVARGEDAVAVALAALDAHAPDEAAHTPRTCHSTATSHHK